MATIKSSFLTALTLHIFISHTQDNRKRLNNCETRGREGCGTPLLGPSSRFTRSLQSSHQSRDRHSHLPRSVEKQGGESQACQSKKIRTKLCQSQKNVEI